MNTVPDLVGAVPVAGFAVLAAFRWGPTAVLTLAAGMTALLTRDRARGARALEVLRTVRQPGSACRPEGARQPEAARRRASSRGARP